MTKKLNIGVLASGGGTNLQAIIDAAESGKIPAKVCVVVSDNPEAYALERAKKHGIETRIFERGKFQSKQDYETQIVAALNTHNVELVCLAGYMRICGKTILGAFPNRVINIHPAILPSFPGLDAQKQALGYGVKVSGCTVHFVDEHTDHGPIICQATVEVKESDTVESLRERILREEHRIYSHAIKLFAEGKLKISGRRVMIAY